MVTTTMAVYRNIMYHQHPLAVLIDANTPDLSESYCKRLPLEGQASDRHLDHGSSWNDRNSFLFGENATPNLARGKTASKPFDLMIRSMFLALSMS